MISPSSRTTPRDAVGTMAVAPARPTAERVAFWIAAVAAAFLHWIPRFPPQVDVAQHAAQIRMLHDWARMEPTQRALFELNFFTPYLPAYALGTALSAVLPVVTTTMLIWSIGVLGTIYATTRLRARLGGDPLWDWLMLPGFFGMTFLWGLLTFQLAVPIALLILDAWIAYQHAPTTRRGAALGVALTLLFFCHSLVTAWLLLVCGVMLLTDWRERPASSTNRFAVGLPLLAPLPIVALWLSITRHVPQAQAPIAWGALEPRTMKFFSQWLGVISGVLPTAMIGALLLVSPFLAGARFTRNAMFRAPVLVTLGIILLAPNDLMGNAFTYSRFFVLLGPALILALSRSDTHARSPLRMLTPAIAIGCLLLIASRMIAFAREQESFIRILDRMQPGRHTLAMIEDASSLAMRREPSYLHFGSWYQAEKGGLVEFSFSAFIPMIVRFRPSYTDAVPESFAQHPSAEYVARHAREFDYILVRAPADSAQPLQQVPLRVVAHDGPWWLFSTGMTR